MLSIVLIICVNGPASPPPYHLPDGSRAGFLSGPMDLWVLSQQNVTPAHWGEVRGEDWGQRQKRSHFSISKTQGQEYILFLIVNTL